MGRGAWQGSMGLIVHEVAKVRHNLTKPPPANRKHYRDTKQNAFSSRFCFALLFKRTCSFAYCKPLCFPSPPAPTLWEQGIIIYNGLGDREGAACCKALEVMWKLLTSSDASVPETINRNSWQEGNKGQTFHFCGMLWRGGRERAGTF